jgi:hypothetical protein
MEYHRPLLSKLSLDVGVTCCTPGNPYCEYKAPVTCGLIRAIDQLYCGRGAPAAACVILPRAEVAHVPVGGMTCT